jgi:hypothetical protein
MDSVRREPRWAIDNLDDFIWLTEGESEPAAHSGEYAWFDLEIGERQPSSS